MLNSQGAASVGDDVVVPPEANGFPYRLQIIAANSVFVWILSAHRKRDSAPCGKLGGHNRLARRARFHEIVQNAVRDRFVERALVPIRGKVKLKRLTFDAEPIRHVIDVDPGEIGLTRDRTNGSEIIRFKMNPVISPRRVWESLQARLGRGSRQFRPASSQQCESTCNFCFCHCNIKAVNGFASIGIASGRGRHMEVHLDRVLIFVGSTESRPTRKQLS